MAFETTRDLLNHVKRFLKDLSDFLDEQASHTENRSARMLLEYLSRNEARLEAFLTEYERDAQKNVLDAWFMFTPKEPVCKFHLNPEKPRCPNFERIKSQSELSVDDVIRTVLACDNCLIEFFKETAEMCTSEEVRDVFLNLAEWEKHEERRLLMSMIDM